MASNLLHLSHEAHRFCTDNPSDGRTLCLWIKSEKGEMDVEQFRATSGWNLNGYLLNLESKIDWIIPILAALQERYQ